MMKRRIPVVVLLAVIVSVVAAGCAKKPPTVARPMPPPAAGTTAIPAEPPAPPRPVDEPIPVPPEPEAIRSGDLKDDLDTLNRSGVLKPVFFELDSSEVSGDGQKALQDNADVMRKNSQWQVTIEGHCDERGTAEYNLALGERRAIAARAYLVSLGIPATRVRTVSYGKEFPFDPARNDEAYRKNRRAHFVITAK